ncbi:hypothetical protein DRO38_04420, partial [Candidatus Bathyarchaeota archaeon]
MFALDLFGYNMFYTYVIPLVQGLWRFMSVRLIPANFISSGEIIKRKNGQVERFRRMIKEYSYTPFLRAISCESKDAPELVFFNTDAQTFLSEGSTIVAYDGIKRTLYVADMFDSYEPLQLASLVHSVYYKWDFLHRRAPLLRIILTVTGIADLLAFLAEIVYKKGASQIKNKKYLNVKLAHRSPSCFLLNLIGGNMFFVLLLKVGLPLLYNIGFIPYTPFTQYLLGNLFLGIGIMFFNLLSVYAYVWRMLTRVRAEDDQRIFVENFTLDEVLGEYSCEFQKIYEKNMRKKRAPLGKREVYSLIEKTLAQIGVVLSYNPLVKYYQIAYVKRRIFDEFLEKEKVTPRFASTSSSLKETPGMDREVLYLSRALTEDKEDVLKQLTVNLILSGWKVYSLSMSDEKWWPVFGVENIWRCR